MFVSISPFPLIKSFGCSAVFNQDKEEAEWKEMQMPPDADSVSLKDLAFGSNYQLEVSAVNANGSSIPATFNFTIAEQSGMWPLELCSIYGARSYSQSVIHTWKN